MAKRTILDDPRYPAFFESYCADPYRFALEVTDFLPSDDQEDLLYAIAPDTARVSVVSGTSTGKTAAFARIALWHLLCQPYEVYEGKLEIGSNTYIGAPNVSQVTDGVWKEMQDTKLAIANGDFAWLCEYFTIGKTRVYVHGYEEQWFIGIVALAKGQSVGIAGKHRYHQLIIVDEASGVQDDHFNVINGTQTQGGNRTLLASQGTRNAGFFYDSHHRLSTDSGGEWSSLRFNSEHSPFATTAWLKQREIETGGRDTPEFQIRVLGMFPEHSDKYLLGTSAIEKVIDAPHVIDESEEWGNIVIVDVAAGVYRDKTVASHFRVINYGDRIDEEPRRADLIDIPVFSNTLDWDGVARQVVDYVSRLSNCTVVVDVGGQGVQFAKKLEKMGLGNVVHSNWGVPCFKSRNKSRFFNLRAQCSVHAAEAVKDGRITLTSQYRKDILSQGSRIPFSFDERARYKIMPKDQMKLEGINSPDLWDTVCMLFLEGAHYIVAENNGNSANKGRLKTALEKAASELN